MHHAGAIKRRVLRQWDSRARLANKRLGIGVRVTQGAIPYPPTAGAHTCVHVWLGIMRSVEGLRCFICFVDV